MDILIGVVIGVVTTLVVLAVFKDNIFMGVVQNIDMKEKITYLDGRPMFITKGGHTYPHPDNSMFKTLSKDWSTKDK